MSGQSLAAVLEREHHDIDTEIEAFAAQPATAAPDPAPLHRAAAALRRHIYLEEEFLFPALRHASLDAPIFVMLREHAQIWASLAALEDELRAEVDRPKVQHLCHLLSVQLQHHNLKEERIIYAAADHAIGAEDASSIGALLQSADMPLGWVCAKAGGRL